LIYHCNADSADVAGIIEQFPTVTVDERFASSSVNLDIPDEIVDDVIDYCDMWDIDVEAV